MKLSHAITCLTAGLSLSLSAQALVITPENNGETLASTILGSGIWISNVNYVGADGASGLFTGGHSAGLDINSGIVLSSGSAVNALGPNDSEGMTSNNGAAGYDRLTEISGFSTYDATILSFDFEFAGGLGGDLFFNFVFGSEEYLEWVNSQYNDVFGLFVDGINVALTESGDPISINTINTAQNSALFVDNTGAIHNTQMDGFTRVLTISLQNLAPGLHTMEFAIADAGDFVLDSWILIQASSFSNVPTDPIKVPEPSSLLLLGLALAGLGARRNKR